MLLESSRHDRTGRAALSFAARLVLGLVVLLIAMALLDGPASVVLGVFGAPLILCIAYDERRARRIDEVRRRDALRSSARREAGS